MRRYQATWYTQTCAVTLTGKRPPNRDPELQRTELVQDTKALMVQDTKTGDEWRNSNGSNHKVWLCQIFTNFPFTAMNNIVRCSVEKIHWQVRKPFVRTRCARRCKEESTPSLHNFSDEQKGVGSVTTEGEANQYEILKHSFTTYFTPKQNSIYQIDIQISRDETMLISIISLIVIYAHAPVLSTWYTQNMRCDTNWKTPT